MRTGLQIANSPQHCKNLDATLAASAARLQIGLPGSLRSSCASAPALRDPAATGAPNRLAGQVAQAGGLKMDLEDARSETLSQPPYSDAESSASSIGGESGASSHLSLVGSSRPRQPPKCRVRGSVAPRAPVPERTTGRKLSEPFNAEMDQRLRQLVEAHQRANISSDVPWTEIATNFNNPDKTPKQCRERYPTPTPLPTLPQLCLHLPPPPQHRSLPRRPFAQPHFHRVCARAGGTSKWIPRSQRKTSRIRLTCRSWRW